MAAGASTPLKGKLTRGVLRVRVPQEDFLIEESTDRIKPAREKPGPKVKIAIVQRLGGVPPPQRIVDKVPASAIPSCEEAFDRARVKPRWQVTAV